MIRSRAVAFAGLVVFVVGCTDTKEKALALIPLKELSTEYAYYQEMKGKPPGSAEQLFSVLREGRLEPDYRPGEFESLTVQWGAKLDVGKTGNRLLASGRKIGGDVAVLLEDGRVLWIPEADFVARPKAEPVKDP